MFTFFPLVGRDKRSSKCLPWALTSDYPQLILCPLKIPKMRSWKLNLLHLKCWSLVTHQHSIINCMLESGCLAQGRWWKERVWSLSWLRGEVVLKLKAGVGCSSREKRWAMSRVSPSYLSKGSDHRLTKDPPKPNIGSAAYHHLEDWAVNPNAWALLDTALPKAPGKSSHLPGLRAISVKWHSTPLLQTLWGFFSPLWVESQALPGPSRLSLN